jgi:hypothetical protein
LTRTWEERHAFAELAGTWLAEVALLSGEKDKARQLATEALTRAEESKSQWFLCTAHLTLGRVLCQQRQIETLRVEHHLRTALNLAQSIASLPLEAWVSLELGEFLQRRHAEGNRQEPTEKMLNGEQEPEVYLARAEKLCEQLRVAPGLKRARALRTHPLSGDASE